MIGIDTRWGATLTVTSSGSLKGSSESVIGVAFPGSSWNIQLSLSGMSYCAVMKPHPISGYNTVMPYSVTREQFEALVEKALRNIPRRYRRYFTNITIIVEDLPDAEVARSMGAPRDALLGLFSGVPYTEKDSFFGIPHPLPDAIFLYQKNIERICRNEEDLVEEIRKTLVHEVGHYFGFSEEELLPYE